jgi:hypothetical protein
MKNLIQKIFLESCFIMMMTHFSFLDSSLGFVLLRNILLMNRSTKRAIARYLITWALIIHDAWSLSQHNPQEQNRRTFLNQGATLQLATFSLPTLAKADNHDQSMPCSDDGDRILLWSGPSWTASRYRTSTLSDDNNAPSPVDYSKVAYPHWMKGYWNIQYKFFGASFPQGKKILSLRTAGAGLGTCLIIPNVGYNPPAPHAMRFISPLEGKSVYDDVPYNLPRRFESFWPQSKVLAVQTNGNAVDTNTVLTPKCSATGTGCTPEENPNLHLPASRAVLEFESPTRRSGRQLQYWDFTLLNHTSFVSGNRFETVQTFSQFNPTQELQTFYQQHLSLEQRSGEQDYCSGNIRVAAFLPTYIHDMDAQPDSGRTFDYQDTKAVAVYEYNILMKSIDESEAASL